MRRRRLDAALLGLTLLAAVPEPSGYRLDHYRDEVPATLRGGTVVDAAALRWLIDTRHPILIDVLPAPRRPEGMAPGAPWMPLPRRDLPGSVWLPDVGRGALAPQVENWFRTRLAGLTAADLAKPLVFYCRAQCWMSWNAAKRAISFGYRDVFWFPDGTEGWEKAGNPLAVAQPEAVPD